MLRLDTVEDPLGKLNTTFHTYVLTRYSSVFGMSSIDFTPLDTTVTGVLPNSVRSAEMSKVCSPSL